MFTGHIKKLSNIPEGRVGLILLTPPPTNNITLPVSFTKLPQLNIKRLRKCGTVDWDSAKLNIMNSILVH